MPAIFTGHMLFLTHVKALKAHFIQTDQFLPEKNSSSNDNKNDKL